MPDDVNLSQLAKVTLADHHQSRSDLYCKLTKKIARAAPRLAQGYLDAEMTLNAVASAHAMLVEDLDRTKAALRKFMERAASLLEVNSDKAARRGWAEQIYKELKELGDG